MTNFLYLYFFFLSFSFHSYGVTVSKDGNGDYTTIRAAIENAPNFSSSRYIIKVGAGIYEEEFNIPDEKINIVLVGAGRETTKIMGSKPLGTLIGIRGANFMAQDIAFENNASIRNWPSQAVKTESNNSIYYRCSFKGFQDTLFAATGRQFYKNCDIYGTVDFIYGYAAAVFQDCMLYARNGRSVAFTAQGKRKLEDNSGFTFQRCNFTMAPEDLIYKSNVNATLGRPWGTYSTVVIMESYIDSMVDARGWETMHFAFVPSHVTYLEFNNTGPASKTDGRVKWPGVQTLKDPKEAEPYTVQALLDGDTWISQSGVPYDGGI